MKETTQPPKDPKKKLWVGYAVILAIVILSNIFLYPALMQAGVKSVNYSTFLQMLESKELATVQIEDQQIYFVDKNDNSYKTNAIAQDNNLVTRLEDAGVEFGTVYQSPTIWDSLLNLLISFLPMIILFWFVNRWASKKMQEMGDQYDGIYNGHHDFRAQGAPLGEDCLPNALALARQIRDGNCSVIEVPTFWGPASTRPNRKMIQKYRNFLGYRGFDKPMDGKGGK